MVRDDACVLHCACIGQPVAPHVLRHTFAVTPVRKGISLPVQQHYPTLPDMTGTALVMFKSFKIRDARIMFGHQDILTQLLPGAKISCAAGERPFLVMESSENRGWWIRLSNVHIELTPQHTDELCEVIDRLAECYVTVAEDLERYVLRSIRFPYAKWGYR